MIEQTVPLTTIAVVILAFSATVGLLFLRKKTDAEVLFALFCGSVALAMLRPFVSPDTVWLWWVVAVGGSATCNAYWLVSRALFRGHGAVGWPHVAVALSVAILIVVWRVAARDGNVAEGSALAVVGELLSLSGSAMLVLAFSEGLRGWSGMMGRDELRLRLGFLTVFGGCVMVGTISGVVTKSFSDGYAWQPAVNSVCAMAIVVFTLWALAHRRRQRSQEPELHQSLPVAISEESGPGETPEDRNIAAAILRLFEVESIHREPELRVADVTRRLGTVEHKISRAISHGLGERNFNQLVNRHRINDACRLLDDPSSTMTILEISFEVGFASLGPFNRAFKAATGLTPSAYRNRSKNRGEVCEVAGGEAERSPAQA
ncbi:MAG: helix-turn-helix transcriptional regulator [Ahniella sp.]|nr:helix-turn-helix transcriptional regulator [Ahniella sp.]